MPVLNTKVAPPSAGVAFNLLTARNLSLSKEQAQIRNTHAGMLACKRNLHTPHLPREKEQS